MISENTHNSKPLEQRAEVALTAIDLKIEIRSIAGFIEGDTTESRIRRAARRAGMSFYQARDVWYGAIKDPRASIIEKIHAAKSEATKNADKLDAAACALESVDADFHSAEIGRLRDTACLLRGR